MHVTAARRIAASHAASVVDARLARSPQDAVEAAVVLEAWGGVGGASAVELGQQIMGATSRVGARPSPVRPVRRAPRSQPESATASVLLMATACASAICWLSRAAEWDGMTVDTAWRLAMPSSVAVAWFARRRWSLAEGYGGLRKERMRAIAVFGIVVVAMGMIPSPAGPLAACLTTVWTGAGVLRNQWAATAALLLAGSAVGTLAGIPARAGAAGSALAIACLVTVATYRDGEPARRPIPIRTAATSALGGSTVAIVIALDTTIGLSTGGPGMVVIVAASIAGGTWAGRYLGHVWTAVERALDATPASSYDRSNTAELVRIVAVGAVVRLAVSLAGGAVLVLAIAHLRGASAGGGGSVELLVAFTLAALAGLAVLLLEAVGLRRAATAAACAGMSVALAAAAVRAHGVTLPAGSGVSLAATSIVIVAINPIRRFLDAPERAPALLV